MAEFNSFAAVGYSRVGLRGTPGLFDNNESEEVDTAPAVSVKELSKEMQALLDSHNRAAVRGKLTVDDESNVREIQLRIQQRKVTELKLKEQAEIDARRRKVLFDDSSSALMKEATSAAASIKESLKQKTIASK